MDISGIETGTQENAGGMPVGPEPSNPSGQTMPVDGGPGSSPTPAPGAVASPGADEYTQVPGPSGDNVPEQISDQMGSQQFAQMPTPDN